ncbi:hypothetical protein ABZ471_30545 [Streptomyces sp. NPDC005728]|uniref:hypothetical protein n=1 Tax=Streptomyces sp. NPDC005728 TaxID=3157054 RepID=UPI0033D2E69F
MLLGAAGRPVRGDNALPGTSKIGCVMPYIPEMIYAKRGDYPELAKHIEYAQNTKHLPVKHGTTKYLTASPTRRRSRSSKCPCTRCQEN